eukprot:2990601-Pleurochrysis_carterae.AAC.1
MQGSFARLLELQRERLLLLGERLHSQPRLVALLTRLEQLALDLAEPRVERARLGARRRRRLLRGHSL